MAIEPDPDPFVRPVWQAAFDPDYRTTLEQEAASVPISQRPVNPDLGNHGCGGPLGCSIH